MSGRFFEVNLRFWSEDDLMQIGAKGFSKLGLKVSEDVLQILAREALRSPQLMQTLCLETCRVLPFDIPFEHQEVTGTSFDLQNVKDKAVRSYNNSTPLDFLRNGPEERGSPRNIYNLRDGSEGGRLRNPCARLGCQPTISHNQLGRFEGTCREPRWLRCETTEHTDGARKHADAVQR
jgi:hypothetical protein